MTRALSYFVIVVCLIGSTAFAEGRHVIFVDNSRTEEGVGTVDRPFRRLAPAQSDSHAGDVIYVAEGSGPYEEGIALKRGQILAGAAYGLENLRAEHIDFDAPVVGAVQGPGPTIHGTVIAAGDNIVAGCTIATERVAGLVAPHIVGPLSIRQVWFRPSRDSLALSIDEANFPVAIIGGGMISQGGNGVAISGGAAAVTFEHFPMSGDAGNVIFIGNRSGGVKFTAGSTIRMASAARDAIVISSLKGSAVFDDAIQITSQGGRGLVITDSDKVVWSSATSRIASTNAAALEIRASSVDIVLDEVSADGVPPGRLVEGITANKLRGRLTVGRGTIHNAQAYGIRVEQSSGVRMAHMQILDTAGVGKLKCPDDLDNQASVVCRAGLFVRHVSKSAFEDIIIDRAQQVGLNANNINDVTFSDVKVPNSGVLLQEMIGSVAFHMSSVADVVIEQKFNQGSVVFDRCTFAGPLRARVRGTGRLQLAVNDLRRADAAPVSPHLVELSASDSSRAYLSLHGAYVVAPSVRDALISVDVANSSEACVDVTGNHLEIDPSASPVRVTARSSARLRMVSGSQASIDAPAGSVSEVSSCQ